MLIPTTSSRRKKGGREKTLVWSNDFTKQWETIEINDFSKI